MRTSSQLGKTDQCEMHSHANITQTSDTALRAQAQKEVAFNMLRGEPIEDIGGEIDSILVSKGCRWENNSQKLSNTRLFDARIRKYVEWELNNPERTIIFPDDMDTTVDFFGETVRALPDYFVDDGNKVYAVKLRTSAFKDETEEIQSNEAYALGLCAEKLFPGRNVGVQMIHLGEKDLSSERQGYALPFNHPRHQRISELDFNDSAKLFFATQHEQESSHTCTPEECAGCSNFNICHFEEPPISVDVEKSVKPINEIRLTYDQQQVINYETGVARINAGAGAGKTLVVAMRIVELLQKGYQPEDICLLTFTRAGAEEMTARVVQYCAGYGLLVDPDKITSTTFNAFCQDLISAHYEELGYQSPPRVIPDETRSGIINRIIDQFSQIPEWNYGAITDSHSRNYKFKKTALNSAKDIFAEIKKEGYTRDNNPYTNRYSEPSIDLIFQMYDEYDMTLFSRNLMEFDDQIIQTFRLLDMHPQLFEEIGFKHIIVDEFQDTDLPQINLLQRMIDTTAFKSFMAVGDDSQSIFGFRHTSPEYMVNFGNYFGRFDDFALVENHRSNANTIKFANKVNETVGSRVEKDLIATKEDGAVPIVNGFYTLKEEYKWMAEDVKRRINDGQDPSEICVMASTGAELVKIASTFTEYGIPTVLMNPIPFKENSRVAALCTFFDSFTGGTTRGLLDYKNAVTHGALKGANAEELERLAQEMMDEIRSGEKSISKFVEYAKGLDENETDACYQDFLEKVSFCQSMDELSEFFRDFKLYGNDSKYKREGKYEGVALTTVHSAKGLEWDTTYLSLTGFDKPEYHRRAFYNSEEKDEIARKWFVGATRAREELIMTGQYVVKWSQKEMVLNDYVKSAYDMLGKVYGYTSGAYRAAQDMEKRENMEAQRSKMILSGIRKSDATPEFAAGNNRFSMGNNIFANRYMNGNTGVPTIPNGRVRATVASPSPEPTASVEDLSDSEIEFE